MREQIFAVHSDISFIIFLMFGLRIQSTSSFSRLKGTRRFEKVILFAIDKSERVLQKSSRSRSSSPPCEDAIDQRFNFSPCGILFISVFLSDRYMEHATLATLRIMVETAQLPLAYEIKRKRDFRRLFALFLFCPFFSSTSVQ
jgi:hypothetical protein